MIDWTTRAKRQFFRPNISDGGREYTYSRKPNYVDSQYKLITCQSSGSSCNLRRNSQSGNTTNPAQPIQCFTCGQEGHKSPACPTKTNTYQKANKKEKIPAKVAEVHLHPIQPNIVLGKVEGHSTLVLLDTRCYDQYCSFPMSPSVQT